MKFTPGRILNALSPTLYRFVRTKIAGKPPLADWNHRVIRSLEELDEVLVEAERIAAISDDQLVAFMRTFSFQADFGELPSPYAPAYRERQLEMYRSICRRDYQIENERHDFNYQHHLTRPHPYSTCSAAMVSDQLIAIGHVIKAMNLPPRATILEMGTGFGNLAIQLALTGYALTVLDIEPKYIDLIKSRARDNAVDIKTICGDFFSLKNIDEKFDAIVFFESLHHCDDHLRLLDMIPDHLNPGGRLILAGEPINPGLPYPWGLNLSGEGVRTMRRHGWLELCFREDYLLDTLAMKGWKVIKHECAATASGVTYVCSRSRVDREA